MKKVMKCIVEDCVPTISTCVKWSGEDIPSLGIYNGDSLDTLTLEIVNKIKTLSKDGLSTFDIASLLEMCSSTAPEENTLINILTLIKDNQICLKEYINELQLDINEYLKGNTLKVHLGCFTLSEGLTRTSLDQLMIDKLCEHKPRLNNISSKLTNLRQSFLSVNEGIVPQEVKVTTCINIASLPLSTQIKNTSNILCDLIESIGSTDDIASALDFTNKPSINQATLNAAYSTFSGWDITPTTFADFYGNTLVTVEDLRQRIKNIEDTCCTPTCEDVDINFTAFYNEDKEGIILRFPPRNIINKDCDEPEITGTYIPEGFTDCGSTGTITDHKGAQQHFEISVTNKLEEEITLSGVSIEGNLHINISARMCNEKSGLVCIKCTSTIVKQESGCCEICVEGEEGSSVIVVYEDKSTTTTPSTTTTTTVP